MTNEMDDVKAEVVRLRDKYHALAGPVQIAVDLAERVDRLEGLAVSVGKLEIVVDRLEKAVWGAAALVIVSVVGQVLQVVLNWGAKT